MSWCEPEFPSFLRLNDTPLRGQTTLCFSVHASLDMMGSNGAMNIGVQISIQALAFNFFEYVCRD